MRAKFFNKVLVWLMAMTMVLSMLPATALAAEPVSPVIGEVYFIPGTVEAPGSIVDAYVITSDTKTPSEKVQLQIPNDIEFNDAGGDSLEYATGRFWEYRDTGFTSIRLIAVTRAKGNNSEFKYGYHDVINSVDLDTGVMILQDGMQHRASVNGSSSKACCLEFPDACGSACDPAKAHGNQLGPYVTFVEGSTFILDLRSGVEDKIDTLAELATLATDATNQGGEQGEPVINTYSADAIFTAQASYKTMAGNLTAVIIVDGTPAPEVPETPDDTTVEPTTPADPSDSTGAHDETCPSAKFTDVDKAAWYHDGVDYVLTNGIMTGYSDTAFGPNDSLTRAMVVQVLYNKEGKPAVTAENKFPDVAADQWYCNAVRWGAEKGVVSGYGDGRFGPDDKVTVEQVAVILHNYAGKPAAEGNLSGVGKYDDWAAGALQWAVANGILEKVPFADATETATRAQTAQMLTNFLAPASQNNVLAARRDAAEAFMRRMGTVRWRVEEDILYTIASNKRPENDTNDTTRLELKAGRIYQGLPYTYAGGTDTAFLEYATKEENGVYTLEGITWETLSGAGQTSARLGNDCSSALTQAWGSIGADITMTNTKSMTYNSGYLPVGDYESSKSDNTNSDKICANNGEQTMFAAYAQLQKADGLVYRGASAGHAIMVVSSHPVYNADGTIDGEASKVVIIDQLRTYFRAEDSFYDETLKENVYPIYGIDTEMTYNYMFEKGCLPITCKALIDPAPIADPVVKDSRGNTAFTKSTLLAGTISCNWMIDTLTMTITTPDGNVVQEGAIRTARGQNYKIEMSRFTTDKPAGVRGYIKPAELTSGQYHCKLVCRLSSGQEFTVRDFDFTV